MGVKIRTFAGNILCVTPTKTDFKGAVDFDIPMHILNNTLSFYRNENGQIFIEIIATNGIGFVYHRRIFLQ